MNGTEHSWRAWALTGSLAVAAFLVVCGDHAEAAQSSQSYPSRPVRLVVPFPPGGGGDSVGRAIAQPLSDALGQPVIVDNRGGASGAIAVGLVAMALPDGHTLLVGDAGTAVIVPSASAKAASDTARSLVPVSLIGTSGYILVVHPSLPAASIKELIALAREKPNQLTFASAGTLTAPHMAGELFKHLAKVQMLHVPYKGGAPASTAVISGEVNMQFSSVPPALNLVKAGRLRALGVSGKERKPELPGVPAIAEVVPGYEMSQWFGIFASPRTPSPIIDKLNAEIVKALGKAEVLKHLSQVGVEAAGSTPGEFTAMIKSETTKWIQVAKETNVRSEP